MQYESKGRVQSEMRLGGQSGNERVVDEETTGAGRGNRACYHCPGFNRATSYLDSVNRTEIGHAYTTTLPRQPRASACTDLLLVSRSHACC